MVTLERIFCFDMPPAVLDVVLSSATIAQAYGRVLARPPTPDEVARHLTALADGRAHVSHLIGSDEFRNLRTRLALR